VGITARAFSPAMTRSITCFCAGRNSWKPNLSRSRRQTSIARFWIALVLALGSGSRSRLLLVLFAHAPHCCCHFRRGWLRFMRRDHPLISFRFVVFSDRSPQKNFSHAH